MSFLKVFKTKTAWAGIAMIAAGVAKQIGSGDGFQEIIEGAAIIFLRHGIQKGG